METTATACYGQERNLTSLKLMLGKYDCSIPSKHQDVRNLTRKRLKTGTGTINPKFAYLTSHCDCSHILVRHTGTNSLYGVLTCVCELIVL